MGLEEDRRWWSAAAREVGLLSVGINLPSAPSGATPTPLSVDRRDKRAYERPQAINLVATEEAQDARSRDQLRRRGPRDRRREVAGRRRPPRGRTPPRSSSTTPRRATSCGTALDRAQSLVDAPLPGCALRRARTLTRKNRDADAKEPPTLIPSFGGRRRRSAPGDLQRALLELSPDDPAAAQRNFEARSIATSSASSEAAMKRSENNTRMEEAAVPARQVFDREPRRGGTTPDPQLRGGMIRDPARPGSVRPIDLVDHLRALAERREGEPYRPRGPRPPARRCRRSRAQALPDRPAAPRRRPHVVASGARTTPSSSRGSSRATPSTRRSPRRRAAQS